MWRLSRFKGGRHILFYTKFIHMKKLLLLLIILLVAAASIAQESGEPKIDPKTLPGWDPTWDVNDPNCPCHEIQRKAEEEYKKMLEEEKKQKEKEDKDKKKISSGGNPPQEQEKVNEVQVQVQVNVNDNVQQNNNTQDVQANNGSSTGSTASPGLKSKTGKKGFRKLTHNIGRKLDKAFPKRKKKKKLLDECWD
jgi:hypothetical protein